MNTNTDPVLEQRARDLLAAEYERDGLEDTAEKARSGDLAIYMRAPFRAIVAALAQQAGAEPVAYVDLANWHGGLRADECFFTDWQDDDTVPLYLGQQPAAPSGEAVAWLRMKPDGTPDWAEDCIGSDDRFLDHELASDGYYLQPLYAAPQQPAAVDEAPTWSRQQPTVPGIYGIRGFNLCRPASEQFEAVVVVREYGGELVCNLHESTSEDDLESWSPICDLDPDFEWRVFVPGWQQRGGRADG